MHAKAMRNPYILFDHSQLTFNLDTTRCGQQQQRCSIAYEYFTAVEIKYCVKNHSDTNLLFGLHSHEKSLSQSKDELIRVPLCNKILESLDIRGLGWHKSFSNSFII
jgi:hypothetical protein